MYFTLITGMAQKADAQWAVAGQKLVCICYIFVFATVILYVR